MASWESVYRREVKRRFFQYTSQYKKVYWDPKKTPVHFCTGRCVLWNLRNNPYKYRTAGTPGQKRPLTRVRNGIISVMDTYNFNKNQ